jgi:hypothetical protein
MFNKFSNNCRFYFTTAKVKNLGIVQSPIEQVREFQALLKQAAKS